MSVKNDTVPRMNTGRFTPGTGESATLSAVRASSAVTRPF
jgi:hypothetical protein